MYGFTLSVFVFVSVALCLSVSSRRRNPIASAQVAAQVNQEKRPLLCLEEQRYEDYGVRL